MRKKLIKILVAVLLFVPLTIGLHSGCSCKRNNENSINVKQIYMFSAVTSAEYLNTKNAQSLTQSGAIFTDTNATSRPEILTSDIENVNTYLNMFDGCLLNDGIKEVSSTPVGHIDIGYENYTFKLHSTLLNIDGTSTKYTMYYNEINTITNEEIDDFERELEISSTISGMLVVDSNIYDILGEKTIEIEEDETEVEIEFTTRSKENSNDYVVVKYSTELNEVEYEYSIFEDGNLLSKTMVEWEKEEHKNIEELTLKFVNLGTGNYSSNKYEIVKIETNNSTKFKVECVYDNRIEETFYVTDFGDYLEYSYSNGFTENIDK